MEDRTFQDAIDRRLEEKIPYFSQFWDEDLIRSKAKRGSIMHPSHVLCARVSRGHDGKDQKEHQRGWKKEAREEETEEENTTEGQEEEEEETEREEEEEEELEEGLEEKEENAEWSQMPAPDLKCQVSLKWQWQRQEMAVAVQEEQELREKETISR